MGDVGLCKEESCFAARLFADVTRRLLFAEDDEWLHRVELMSNNHCKDRALQHLRILGYAALSELLTLTADLTLTNKLLSTSPTGLLQMTSCQ